MSRNPSAPALHGSLDSVLISLTLLLVALGLLMTYSTTGVLSQERYHDSFFFFRRQVAAAFVGLFAMIVGVRIGASAWLKRVSPWLFIVSVSLLLLTMVPGLGDDAGGAQRWLRLGPLRFQPGELSKLGFVIFFAGYLSRQRERLESFRYGLMIPLLLLGIVAALYLKQPDFGSASVVVICCLAMLTVCGLPLRFLLIGGGLALISACVLVAVSPYRLARVLSFLSPTADPGGRGYQLIQSLIAIATGGVEGVGLGNSQQKLYFLPAAHTDFMFAVICEELGFVGAIVVISMFCWFLIRGVTGALRLSKDVFSFSLATGLTLLISLQAFLNMGVVTGALPTKGLVLPLVGYGGTSLVTSLLTVGILLGLLRRLPLASQKY